MVKLTTLTMLNKTGCTQSNLAQRTKHHLTIKTKIIVGSCLGIKITLAVGVSIKGYIYIFDKRVSVLFKE